MTKKINIIGHKYGRWTVIKFFKRYKNESLYECKCDCGTIKNVNCNHLRRNISKSCGCYRLDLRNSKKLPHRLKIMSVYFSMHDRCYNINNKSYYRYGKRGIIVCPQWHNKNTFYNFCLANGWLPGLEIDRINNDGNYEPTNVRFVTSKENIANSSVVRNAKGQWSSYSIAQ